MIKKCACCICLHGFQLKNKNKQFQMYGPYSINHRFIHFSSLVLTTKALWSTIPGNKKSYYEIIVFGTRSSHAIMCDLRVVNYPYSYIRKHHTIHLLLYCMGYPLSVFNQSLLLQLYLTFIEMPWPDGRSNHFRLIYKKKEKKK